MLKQLFMDVLLQDQAIHNLLSTIDKIVIFVLQVFKWFKLSK